MGGYSVELVSEFPFFLACLESIVLMFNLSVNQHKTQNFATIEVENFPNNASWDDLRNHYLLMHPSESQEIATLTVPQIIELRERLQDKRTSL